MFLEQKIMFFLNIMFVTNLYQQVLYGQVYLPI